MIQIIVKNAVFIVAKNVLPAVFTDNSHNSLKVNIRYQNI